MNKAMNLVLSLAFQFVMLMFVIMVCLIPKILNSIHFQHYFTVQNFFCFISFIKLKK